LVEPDVMTWRKNFLSLMCARVRTAKTLKEDEELLKVGFEYVTELNGIKIYRKRR